MKYTIILLVVLGIIAAISAVLLVQTMRVSMTGGRNTGSVDVAILKKSLPAMSVLTADTIEISKIKAKEAPAGYISSSTQAVGKILAVPVVQGQVLTSSALITQGSEAQLAAAVPPGMRAVSVALSSNSVSGGLLYPGCVVDVLATFKLSGSGRNDIKGEAISTTLLYGIQVLAVQGESVISKPEDETKEKLTSKSNLAGGSQRVSVVLLVDPKQAEALQLAMDNGTVSLAMRNPLDQQDVRSEATVLNRGQLSKLGSLLGTSVRTANPVTVSAGSEGGIVIEGGQSPETVSYAKENGQAAEPANWGVTIIRGSEVKEEEFKQ
jgi:pilus assembly protein CpaB